MENIKFELSMYMVELSKRNRDGALIEDWRLYEIGERLKCLAEEIDEQVGFKYAETLIRESIKKEVKYPKKLVTKAIKLLLEYIDTLEQRAALCNSRDVVVSK